MNYIDYDIMVSKENYAKIIEYLEELEAIKLKQVKELQELIPELISIETRNTNGKKG